MKEVKAFTKDTWWFTLKDDTHTHYSSKTLDRIIPLKHPCMSVTGDFSYNGDNIKVNVVNGQETLLPISLLII